MRKALLVLVAGASWAASGGTGWAQGTEAPALGSASNPLSRASSLGAPMSNSVTLNGPKSDLGLNMPISASSLTSALDSKDRSGSASSAKLGSGAAPVGDDKLFPAPHSSGNLANALKAGGLPGAKSAALSEGGEPVDNKNAAALMGGNTLAGSTTSVKTGNSLTNTLK